MNDLMMRQRLRDIYAQKIAMGGGCMCMNPPYMGYGMDGMDDMDDMYGEGVIVGGRRRKSRSKKGSFGRKVGAYMRKHRVSLADAAHALRGSGEGVYAGARKRKVGRPRKRYGSKVSRRRRGGISAYEQAKRKNEISKLTRKLKNDEEEYNLLCGPDAFAKVSNYADYKKYNKHCNLTERDKRKLYTQEALDDAINKYLEKTYPKKKINE